MLELYVSVEFIWEGGLIYTVSQLPLKTDFIKISLTDFIKTTVTPECLLQYKDVISGCGMPR